MSIKLKTILNKTNLSAIINSPTLESDFKNFYKKNQIDELTFKDISLTITKNGKDKSIKEYIHTLVDDLKALTHYFWEYYRVLTAQNENVFSLTKDVEKLNEDKENTELKFKLFEEQIRIDEQTTLSTLHRVIDSNREKDKQTKMAEKIEATQQMYKNISEKMQILERKKEEEKRELRKKESDIKKQQEDIREDARYIHNFYKKIIQQITTHMKKFVSKWKEHDSLKLMSSLKLHMPEYVSDEQSGLTMLTAPPNLKKLQTIGVLLYEIENKVIELEEINEAEQEETAKQNADRLIEEEESAAAAAAPDKTKKKKKKKRKRKIKTKLRKRKKKQ